MAETVKCENNYIGDCLPSPYNIYTFILYRTLLSRTLFIISAQMALKGIISFVPYFALIFLYVKLGIEGIIWNFARQQICPWKQRPGKQSPVKYFAWNLLDLAQFKHYLYSVQSLTPWPGGQGLHHSASSPSPRDLLANPAPDTCTPRANSAHHVTTRGSCSIELLNVQLHYTHNPCHLKYTPQ